MGLAGARPASVERGRYPSAPGTPFCARDVMCLPQGPQSFCCAFIHSVILMDPSPLRTGYWTVVGLRAPGLSTHTRGAQSLIGKVDT